MSHQTFFYNAKKYLADHFDDSYFLFQTFSPLQKEALADHMISSCVELYNMTSIRGLQELWDIVSWSCLVRDFEGGIYVKGHRLDVPKIYPRIFKFRYPIDDKFKLHIFIEQMRLDIKTKLLSMIDKTDTDLVQKTMALPCVFKHRYLKYEREHEYYDGDEEEEEDGEEDEEP